MSSAEVKDHEFKVKPTIMGVRFFPAIFLHATDSKLYFNQG